MNLSKHAQTVRYALAKGYRVTVEGVVVSPRGRKRKSVAVAGKLHLRVSVCSPFSSHVDVHKLAAFQWFGEAALEHDVHVRHLDGDATNNAKCNLALGSARDNSLDRLPAERREQALLGAEKRRRLTPDQAREVVALSSDGLTGKAIANRFGVRRSTVSEILSGKLYSEVTGLTQVPRTRPANDTLPEAAGGAS